MNLGTFILIFLASKYNVKESVWEEKKEKKIMESSSAVSICIGRKARVGNHMRINDLLHFKDQIKSMKNFLQREKY